MKTRLVHRASAATALAAAVTTLAAVPVAFAAYAGSDGLIAYSSTAQSNIAIYQVNPASPSSGSTELTLGLNAGGTDNGGADVEPFYSPDGKTVYFASDRSANGDYAVYATPSATPESSTSPATELSAVPGQEQYDDYSPSVAPDDNTVIFSRFYTGTNQPATIDTLWAPSAPGTPACVLYTPTQTGSALVTPGSNGSESRVVVDPANPSEAVYAGVNGDLWLLTGIQWTAGSNPCNQQANITDTDLSAEAFSGQSAYTGANGGADSFPDWSSDGNYVVFQSTRGGGVTLFTINMAATTPVASPVWSNMAKAGANAVSEEPVFAPGNDAIAYVNQVKGSNIVVDYANPTGTGTWQANTSNGAQANQVTSGPGLAFNSEPDWQPTQTPPVLPEAPYSVALPGAALLVGAGVFGGRRLWRRRHSLA